MCMFCKSLFVLSFVLLLFFSPLCCLFFFDIRILIIPQTLLVLKLIKVSQWLHMEKEHTSYNNGMRPYLNSVIKIGRPISIYQRIKKWRKECLGFHTITHCTSLSKLLFKTIVQLYERRGKYREPEDKDIILFRIGVTLVFEWSWCSLFIPLQRSCTGVYWLHHVRPSVRPSVDKSYVVR